MPNGMLARSSGRQIALAYVDSSGSGHTGKVNAIVHDDGGLVFAAECDKAIGKIQKWA